MIKFYGLCLAVSIASVSIADVYVDKNGTNPVAPYNSWSTAATTISDAVSSANAGDTIYVTNGHYRITSQITVDGDITVESINGPEVTIVDAQTYSRVFELYNGATLSGLTITQGFATGNGGGVFVNSGVITNCIITECSAVNNGGGVAAESTNNVVIYASEISQNTANYGGGLYKCEVINSLITSNSIHSSGQRGGGAYSSYLSNCIISHNSSRGQGGGIYRGTAKQCLIVNNRARSDSSGGGASEATVLGCTVYNNLNSSNRSDYEVSYSTAISSILGSVTSGTRVECYTGDPLFVDATNGNYRLQPDSPCIDAGVNAYAISDYDLDGNPRIVNYVLDIGVYEYQGLEGDLDGDGLQDTWEDTYFSGEADPNADADGDGLTNKEEHDGGTHPLQTDSDGDGIEDNVELVFYNTDPTEADTDGDGLDDGQEINVLATSATNVDSDSDTIEDGDEVSNGLDPLTSNQGQDSDADGLLDAEEVNQYLTNPLSDDSDGDGFLDGDEISNGTNPNFVEGPPVLLVEALYESAPGAFTTLDATPIDGYPTNFVYQWSFAAAPSLWFPIPDATNSTYSFPGSESYNGEWRVEVSNSIGQTNAVFFYQVFSDTDLDGISDYREEELLGTDPLEQDSDGDGLSDYDEYYVYSTSPTSDDPDGDGLSDYDEVQQYGTNPNLADSDGDGLSDSEELQQYGTDPLQVDSDSDSLSDYDEVNTHATNPLLADSDADGLEDDEEVNVYQSNPLSADSDADGLTDGDEALVHASNLSSSDTDADTFEDAFEVIFSDLGFDINVDSSHVYTQVDQMLNYFPDLREVSVEQAKNMMRDLRVGSQTFDVSNGTATIRMYVDESSDLTSSWTNTQHVLEVDIPADQDTMFYRFRME